MNIKRYIAKALRVILQPPAITSSKISKKASICSGAQINNTSVEKYSYVGHDCFLNNVTVGSFTSIADNCRIGGATHPIQRVSMSPVFHSGKNVMKKNFANFPSIQTPKTTIGADVWIGANAIILSGVSIGNGAVIGAGSVVTKNVGDYEIWAGNPARKIRDRFDDSTRKKLLDSKWWTWDEKRIEDNAILFDDVDKFLASLK